MAKSAGAALYDIRQDFDYNAQHGPFGGFADGIKYRNMGQPGYDFLGFKIFSPYGIASCPATMNSDYVRAAWDKGFDVLSSKTQRSVKWQVNPFPNILRVEVDGQLPADGSGPLVGSFAGDSGSSLVNSFGNNSGGPEVWVKEFSEVLSNQPKGQILIMSVVGTIQDGFGAKEYHEDFAEAADLAAGAGAKIVELNLSCPNVVGEGVVCYSKDAVIDICKRTRARLGDGVKILAKIGYFTADQQSLLEGIIRESFKYLDGYTAINTIAAPIVDDKGKQAFPGSGREKAGVSGPSIKWAGVDMVKRLDSLRKKMGAGFTITGVGGVSSPADYDEYIAAGADAVQSAAGIMWNVGLAADIKKHLKIPLKKL